MKYITPVIEYLNKHLDDNDSFIIQMLNSYIHSSCRWEKQCYPDYRWVQIQPAWPEKKVTSYRYYSDPEMSYAHKTNRLMLTFDDNTEYDIAIYKFKRYLRNVIQGFNFDKDLTDIEEDKTYSKCPYCGKKTPMGDYKVNGIKYPYDANIAGFKDDWANHHYGVNIRWLEMHCCKKCNKEYYVYIEH